MPTGNAPVKYIVGVLTNEVALREAVIIKLTKYFGEPDLVSGWYPFNFTSFYASEMGENIKRSFISFEKLLPPEQLPDSKVWCAEVEEEFKIDGKRLVNLDPGYVDYFKVVLASGKFGGHKIAMKRGCWADFIMMYNKGKWEPLPWCFPDFAAGTYDLDLLEIRRLFKIDRQKIGS